jgi:eukaryotic-like serine/threonine-protein kinase
MCSGIPPPHDATVLSNRPPIGEQKEPASRPPRTEPTAELVGKSLGPFHLHRYIGGGGMGAVFEATDLELDRTVAVKVLNPRRNADSSRRFRIEAQSAARLNHDNIARLYQVGDHQGWEYIVFEFVEGDNLRDLVARIGPLPVARAISILVQIAAALDHACGQGVIHRDIKPSNILITTDSRAKLVDMGLARLRIVEDDANDHTESGVTLGTYDYISPEQGKDPRNVDVRSDLYSLGCTAYFMLTGRPPFPDGTPLQKLLRHAGEAVDEIRTLRPDIPPALAACVHKLLEKSPERRYQWPRTLHTDLQVIGHSLGMSVQALPQHITLARREVPARHRALPWLLPLAILLLITSFLWLQNQLRPELPPAGFPDQPGEKQNDSLMLLPPSP